MTTTLRHRPHGRHQGKTSYFPNRELHNAIIAVKSKLATQIAVSGFAFTGIVAIATATTAVPVPDDTILTAAGNTTVVPGAEDASSETTEQAPSTPARNANDIAVIQAAELISQVRSLGEAADPELLEAAAELELLAAGLHSGTSATQAAQVGRHAAASRSTERDASAITDTSDNDTNASDSDSDSVNTVSEEVTTVDLGAILNADTAEDTANAPTEQPTEDTSRDTAESTDAAKSTDAADEPVSAEQVSAAALEVEELLTLATTVEVTSVAEITAEKERIAQAERDKAWEEAVVLANDAASYGNGRIPLSALRSLDTAPGHYLRADAAMMWEELNAEFTKVFGHSIGLTDSYRSYSAQVATKAAKGFWAATPGTSNHGWGLAVDIKGAAAQWGTAERNWLVRNGGRYGWISPDWAQPGQGKEEPWHWEYVRPDGS